jgi:hypothetical protein
MQQISRYLAFLVTMCAAGTPAFAGSSSLAIVVGNGAFAGTYNLDAKAVFCFHSVKRRVYSAVWKDYNPPSAKSIAEAGVEVIDPDVSGPKVGTLQITFGDPAKAAAVYRISAQPVTLTLSGSHGEIVFQGKTKDDISIRLTAVCFDTAEA